MNINYKTALATDYGHKFESKDDDLHIFLELTGELINDLDSITVRKIRNAIFNTYAKNSKVSVPVVATAVLESDKVCLVLSKEIFDSPLSFIVMPAINNMIPTSINMSIGGNVFDVDYSVGIYQLFIGYKEVLEISVSAILREYMRQKGYTWSTAPGDKTFSTVYSSVGFDDVGVVKWVRVFVQDSSHVPIIELLVHDNDSRLVGVIRDFHNENELTPVTMAVGFN